MREILFRGKSVIPQDILEDMGISLENGWVYGSYVDGFIISEVVDATDMYITIGRWCKVDPETVGQYTGLTDKNGQKIFEGDVVQAVSKIVTLSGVDTGGSCRQVYEVVWNDGCWSRIKTYDSLWSSQDVIKTTPTKIYPDLAAKFYEVIGNVHDNPELLEVGE